MLKETKKNKTFLLLVGLYLFFSAWWIAMAISESFRAHSHILLSEVYGVIALVGGIYGFTIAHSVGGWKSYFGKSIILLSAGLLLQEFGQLAYSYLNSIAHVALPYPSVPDIGYFGSIPVYIVGAYFLMKGLGVFTILKKSPAKLLFSVLISFAIVAMSYTLFLKGYSTQDRSSLAIVFDFAYPLGQSIYVSMALMTLFAVGGMLGGVMRKPVLIFLLAFLAQYSADSNYLYQSIHGTWGPSGYGDFLYMTAYFLMAVSLIFICAPIISLRTGVRAAAKTAALEEKS